jgi:hypothetical protein
MTTTSDTFDGGTLDKDQTPASRRAVTRMAARLRRGRATAAAAAAVLGLGLATAPVTPAAAADSVSFCFVHTTGAAYAYDTYLEHWANGQWNNLGYLGKSPTGCDSFSLSAWSPLRSYALRVRAQYRVGTVEYRGTTPYYAPAGSGHFNLGTGLVNSGRWW